jgi:hypothetical protein
MSYLFIKNLFEREVCIVFIKNKKLKIKKPKKPIFSGFL